MSGVLGSRSIVRIMFFAALVGHKHEYYHGFYSYTLKGALCSKHQFRIQTNVSQNYAWVRIIAFFSNQPWLPHSSSLRELRGDYTKFYKCHS